MDPSALVEKVRASIVGGNASVPTPYGDRRITYADYTASGRSLSFLEDAIRADVMPFYANTHTESSGTGRQTTRFREDARNMIRSCVGANPEEHAVIFAGSGSTAAIDRMITMLGIRVPAALEDRYHLSAAIPEADKPVVFIGPYEHHSNVLPWRESIATMVEIGADADGHIDLDELDEQLAEHAGRRLIGSFSAASNVTGILSDVPAVTGLLHRHGALAFWDFAAAAPYVEIDMGSAAAQGDHLDAVFLSPHKFIGGPGTPGVLVVRRDLLTNRVPSVPGGGTVSYVNPEDHSYLDDPEHREEGGTPAIIESIRAGLVFDLKCKVGVDTIRELEESYVARAIEAWSANPSIRLLGSPDSARLSIISFLIRAPDHLGQDRYLHHNFVVAVLNDLFGIQTRGGCSCAGPYGHRLLDIDLDTSHLFAEVIADGWEVVKPGWVRLNFNYFIGQDEFGFLLDAVDLVAREGWRLLPDYEYVPATALWRHRAGTPAPRSLVDIDVFGCCPDPATGTEPEPGWNELFARYLARASEILTAPRPAAPSQTPLPEAAERLRWFPVPSEVEPEGRPGIKVS